MEKIEAVILLRNLLARLESFDIGRLRLSGPVTDQEVQALELAILALGDAQPTRETRGAAIHSVLDPDVRTEAIEQSPAELNQPAVDDFLRKLIEPKELSLGSVSDTDIPTNMRLCMDFGTAMSKATLVIDDQDLEELYILQLGVPGDNEEDSKTMLISSVYIGTDGRLWFGKKAIAYSVQDGDGRYRMDNIKRWLSEDQMNVEVDEKFNPTQIPILYADMILAYLTFFTWTINQALIDETALAGVNVSKVMRRFAMPCLPDAQSREVSDKIRRYLGEAQILADTFSDEIHEGLTLEMFISTVKELRRQKPECNFIGENLTEPLGVAGSLVSWQNTVDTCALVVDVGAGTSDFSMFLIHVDPDPSKKTSAIEIEGASRGVRLAGNHLDSALKHMVLSRAGITSNHPQWLQINWGDRSIH